MIVRYCANCRFPYIASDCPWCANHIAPASDTAEKLNMSWLEFRALTDVEQKELQEKVWEDSCKWDEEWNFAPETREEWTF